MEWTVWLVTAFVAVSSLNTFIEARRNNFRWSRWSDYTECSRSCGGGIQMMTRTCESGRCEGNKIFYRTCNPQECPEQSVDFRTAQCREFNDVRMEVKGITRRHSWRPHFDPSAPCALICENEYGHTKTLKGSVVDGTHCDNGKTFGLCIGGYCRHVGCDHKLGSMIKEDKCLQCGGSGDRCKTIRGDTMGKRLDARRSNVVASIPEGAMTLKISVSSISRSSMELVSEEGKRISLTEAPRSFGRHKVIQYAGSLFTYTAKGDKMEFFARGPIDQNLKLSVRFQVLSPFVKYEYSMVDDPRDGQGNEAQRLVIQRGKYIWRYGAWSDCSVECGPGYKLRAIVCSDIRNGKNVSPALCDRALMPSRNESCSLGECKNDATETYKWIPGHWGECSVDCGIGEQVKLMYCIETGVDGKSVLAKEDLCSRYAGPKPRYERACKGDLGSCAKWTTGQWSECSVTCGLGRRVRDVLCQRTSANNAVPVTVSDEECDDYDFPEMELLCTMTSCRGDGTESQSERESTTTTTTTTTPRPAGCRESRFGCCPDGQTSARGRNNRGCPRTEEPSSAPPSLG